MRLRKTLRIGLLATGGAAARLRAGEGRLRKLVRPLTQANLKVRLYRVSAQSQRQFLDRYCATCHNDRLKTGGLSLDQVDVSRPETQPELWEKVVRKLHTGVMPPSNVPQPPQADRLAMLTWLERSLDAAAAAHPNPGRTETLRRLNRTEYQNAIRDLLALDIDAASLLPADESGHGFDNVNVGDLSPTLLDRYISAANKISRLAVGSAQSSLQNEVFLLPADLTQEDQLPGLPIGTRGGMSRTHTFAQDGEYVVQVLLARDLAGTVSGLREDRPHELLVLVDRKPVATFTVQKPANGDDTLLDKDFTARVALRRGPARARCHLRQGRRIAHRHGPAADGIPFQRPAASADGARDQPGLGDRAVCAHRRRGHTEPPPLVHLPARPGTATRLAQEERCAGTILSTLMRRAYRRPIATADVAGPMAFYREARADGDFDAGIAAALSAVLANPEFLFRVERDPQKVAAGGVYRISDSRAGVAVVVLPVEQHPGRRAARCRRAGPAQSTRRAREAGAPDARRPALVQPRDELRRPVAAAAQHRCGQSQCRRSIGTSTTTCGRPSGRRPSSSSTACCARIAACSRSSGPTTRFSTSAWRSTTAFPPCTEAGSAG